MKHELCVLPGGRQICCQCGISKIQWGSSPECTGSDPKAGFIEFKTPADARKAQKLFVEMGERIKAAEERITIIEGFLKL